MNAITLRYISREMLGIVNVRLLLLYSSGLFLSREAFRKACLSKSKQSDKSLKHWQNTINLLWAVLPIGVISCTILSFVWVQLLEVPDQENIPYYTISTILFAISVMIELFAEPLWVIAQAFLFVKLKVIAEGLAMIVKCIVTTILVIYFPQLGILSFSFAQLLFSVTYCSIYYIYFAIYINSNTKYEEFPFTSLRQFLPNFSSKLSKEAKDQSSLISSFFKQSILKQFLTEGERYVMTILNVLSFSDQGVYDVVNNLGSLAARFIFLPIEESYYVFFAKLLCRGKSVSDMDKSTIESVQHVLFCLLRLVSMLGIIILAFGFPYSYLLLDLYGGSTLSEGNGPLLLRAYCVYVLLIAINGTTECFVFAAMNQSQVDGYNKKMLGFSALFLVASYCLTLIYGSVGFIFANCINMGVRVLHSIYFINNYFGDMARKPLSGVIPHPAVLVSLATSFAICTLSEKMFCCDMGLMNRIFHILVGGLCLVMVGVTILTKEKILILFLHNQYIKKKQS